MEFWPEFLASTSGSEFVAGGSGGMAGVMAGHPLDTIRIRLQQPRLPSSSAPASAIALIHHIVATEGPTALFKGMASPLATIAFQVSGDGFFFPLFPFSSVSSAVCSLSSETSALMGLLLFLLWVVV